MDKLPPRWVRRLVVTPLVLALCLALIALAPVYLLASAIADVFVPGHWRTVRMATFAAFYLVMEVVGLVAMFVLWVRFGFGLKLKTEQAVEVHYRFMARWLLVIYRA